MKISHNEKGTPILNVTGYEVYQGKDGYFRFVSHTDSIATSGFLYEATLLDNRGCLLATDAALNTCKERYTALFPAK